MGGTGTGNAKVSCGGHKADTCSGCPQGRGAEWCNGDCDWCQNSCQLKTSNHCSECADDNSNCASWARDGECQKNPGYMLVSCKRSCNVCNDCVNGNSYCTAWASIGYCSKNSQDHGYKQNNCRKACKFCS